jgi:large subunit ribosomal protein L21
MYAVIRSGGKQYRVAAEDRLRIEKLEGQPGEQVLFDEVLMLAGEGEPQIGAPLIGGASVAAEIEAQERGPKIIVFKKRRRQNYRRTRGHRQDLTLVRITEILTGGAKPKAKPPAKKEAAAKDEEATPAKKSGGAARQPSAVEEQQVAGATDDLTLIGGLGPKLKERLGEAGITSLTQLAALGDDEVEKLDAELDLKGRIAREDWVGQAKQILEGGGAKTAADAKPAGETD